jgi:hypothetical protein
MKNIKRCSLAFFILIIVSCTKEQEDKKRISPFWGPCEPMQQGFIDPDNRLRCRQD